MPLGRGCLRSIVNYFELVKYPDCYAGRGGKGVTDTVNPNVYFIDHNYIKKSMNMQHEQRREGDAVFDGVQSDAGPQPAGFFA